MSGDKRPPRGARVFSSRASDHGVAEARPGTPGGYMGPQRRSTDPDYKDPEEAEAEAQAAALAAALAAAAPKPFSPLKLALIFVISATLGGALSVAFNLVEMPAR